MRTAILRRLRGQRQRAPQHWRGASGFHGSMPEPGTTPRTTPRRAPVNRYEYERRERNRRPGLDESIATRCVRVRRSHRCSTVDALSSRRRPANPFRPPPSDPQRLPSRWRARPAPASPRYCRSVPVRRSSAARCCPAPCCDGCARGSARRTRPGTRARLVRRPVQAKNSAACTYTNQGTENVPRIIGRTNVRPTPRQHQPHRGGDESDGKARPWRRVGRTHHCRPSHLSCLTAAPAPGKARADSARTSPVRPRGTAAPRETRDRAARREAPSELRSVPTTGASRA